MKDRLDERLNKLMSDHATGQLVLAKLNAKRAAPRGIRKVDSHLLFCENL